MTTTPKRSAVTSGKTTARRTSSTGQTRAAASDAAPVRRARARDSKRSAILDAALELFSTYGLHGASVDQVAALARVSKSNLLYYFSTKEDLYLAVLRDLLELWLEPLRAFESECCAADAIRDYIRRKLADSRDHPRASRLFCLEIVQGAPLLRGELEHALRSLVDDKAEVIRAWTASGQLASVDPYHLIFALWATTQHYADFATQVRAVSGRTLDDPAFFEEAVKAVHTIVLSGILTRN
jgi:TetR/AcrR family transcriptional regulator